MTPRLVPPGAREDFLGLPRGRVRVLHSTADHPPGRLPLLLVHGGGVDNAAISWFRVFDEQGPQRAVHAADLPGFGHSDGPPRGGPDAMADAVAETAAAMGVERAVVVGVSMGGDVAMNVALRHPGLVAGLVLVGSGGLIGRFPSLPVHVLAWLGTRLPDRILDPLTRLSGRYAERILARSVVDLDSMPRPAAQEYITESRRLATSEGYRRYTQAALAPTRMRNDLRARLDRITVPVLLFHGQDDALVDPRGSREAAALLPDAALVMVPRCGHWAHLEAGDRFRRELEDFLARRLSP